MNLRIRRQPAAHPCVPKPSHSRNSQVPRRSLRWDDPSTAVRQGRRPFSEEYSLRLRSSMHQTPCTSSSERRIPGNRIPQETVGSGPIEWLSACPSILRAERPDVPRTSLGQDRFSLHDASRKRQRTPIHARRLHFQVNESLSFGQSSRFLILRVAAISYHFTGI